MLRRTAASAGEVDGGRDSDPLTTAASTAGRCPAWVVAALVAGALAIAAWTLRDSYLGIVEVWRTNDTFSHGWLIVPISVWLAWRARDRLHGVAWKPDWLGVVACAGLCALWVAARGAGVAGAEQFAAVALVPALFVAIMGRAAARAWAFPLGFLLFAVPVGQALVPALMQLTADFATLALKATGVPVARSFMYISLPGGDFEVARACSGLNYLVTGIVLGVLHAHLMYRSWRKRLLDVLAFIVVPVLANGVRVYITILVSHLTDMRYGPGEEHVWFGRVFFVAVLMLMFWIGTRWHDEPPPRAASLAAQSPQPRLAYTELAPAVAAILLLFAAPAWLHATTVDVEARLAVETDRLVLPAAAAGWSGPEAVRDSWRPLFDGARVERRGAYRAPDGAAVDVYVAVYGIGVTAGAEMISFHNRLVAAENESLQQRHTRDIVVADGPALPVIEQTVRDRSGARRVWYFYMVGDRVLLDRFTVKGFEALAFVTRGAVTERLVALSTPVDGQDEDRLRDFVRAHAGCVGAGFAFEACGP